MEHFYYWLLYRFTTLGAKAYPDNYFRHNSISFGFVVSISIMSFLSEIALSVYYLGGNSLQDVRLSTYLLKVSGMVTEGYGITGIGEYNLRNKVFTFVSFYLSSFTDRGI